MVRSASVVEECESLLRSPPRAEVSQRRAIGTFARPERSLSSGTDRVVITMLGLIAIVGSAVVVGAVVMIKHHDRARTCAVVVGAALVWISVRTVKSAGVGLSRICLRADYASVLAGEALAVGTYAVVTIGAVAWQSRRGSTTGSADRLRGSRWVGAARLSSRRAGVHRAMVHINHQDARRPRPRQARPTRPDPGSRPRLRDRHRPSRRRPTTPQMRDQTPPDHPSPAVQPMPVAPHPVERIRAAPPCSVLT